MPMFSDADRLLLNQWEKLAKSCGWIYCFENICFICNRPTEIHQTTDNRLHCETGPALLFSDGYSIYAYKGILVSKQVIMAPNSLTVKQIIKEKNQEVRRVMIERFGQVRFLKESGASLIHEDETGKLWKKELANDEPVLMVEVINSSPEPTGEYKTYFLRVHPELRLLFPNGELGDPQPMTAHSAIASTFGKTALEYHPLIQT